MRQSECFKIKYRIKIYFLTKHSVSGPDWQKDVSVFYGK